MGQSGSGDLDRGESGVAGRQRAPGSRSEDGSMHWFSRSNGSPQGTERGSSCARKRALQRAQLTVQRQVR